MKRCWPIAVALVLAATSATAAPPRTLAETLTGQARADYDAARVLIGDGDYAGARIKFQSAFDVSKDSRLLWNLAASEKQLRHYAKAIEILKLYRADTGPLVSAKEKAEATEVIKALEPFTVSVSLDVSQPDASVEIDDTAVGKTPLPGPVIVDIGQRKIRVHKEGFADYAATMSVGGSTQQTIPVKLEKEVHEGKISVIAPPGSSVFIDGKQVVGKPGEVLETKLPSGGHTLRVTAPGMRVYEREIGVKDNEARLVEVSLEREAEPEKPRLRVAVGCGDAEPRGTEDGLGVFIDGSPSTAVASGGKKTWSAERHREELQYVEFPIDRGPHRVVVRMAGCAPDETTIDVASNDGSELRGALRPDPPRFERSPAATPDWGRIGLAAWAPVAGRVRLQGAGAANGEYQTRVFGFAVEPALTFKWFAFGLDLAYARGAAMLPPFADFGMSWFRAGGRAGLRLPLGGVAVRIDGTLGFDHLSGDSNEGPLRYPDRIYLGLGPSVDVHVSCNWLIFAGGELDKYQFAAANEDTIAARLGVALQPSARCARERSTTFELKGAR